MIFGQLNSGCNNPAHRYLILTVYPSISILDILLLGAILDNEEAKNFRVLPPGAILENEKAKNFRVLPPGEILENEEAKIFRVLPRGNTRLKLGDIFSSSIAPRAILD
jgi:hypothetical protein